jgi:predicted Zn-dependent protease with MMP-like domain/Tfp pilus assembly protein PilF
MTSDQEDDQIPTSDPKLDAAWAALEAGDVAGARRLGAEVGEDSPDVLLLLAACAREQDDTDGAIALLRRAAAADPDWATPELWLAELLAADEETVETALRHAGRALDRADDDDEFLSALALKAGLEAELGKIDDARETLSALPPGDVALGDLAATLEIADLHLALGDATLARERLRALTAAEPTSADAWHALGCAAAELEDEDEMRSAWRRTWTLDAAPGKDKAADRAVHLTDVEIASVAEAALEELPPRAQELLRDVPIVIADLPAESDVDSGVDPRALGLFSGTGHADPTHLGGQPGLTQILLFRRNLERIAAGTDELRDEVRMTLIHETGHFFGLNDAALDELGLG